MAIEIGDAVWKIGGDTSGLKAKLKGASKAIALAGAAAGAAVVAFAGKSVTSYASMGDEIQKMALKTGFSTEKLSELRHAAEQGGASFASIGKASKKLSSTIFEAGKGTKTYTDALDALGLKYTDLKGLSPEEQFTKTALALADVGDASDKAAIAQLVFGRAGTDMLPMLADGSAGIQKMADEAHKLGIVFDQQSADSAAAFNDALDFLKKSMTGLMFIIAKQLVPTLTEWARVIGDTIIKMKDFTVAHPALTKVVVVLGTAIGALAATMIPILMLLPGITAAMGLFGGATAVAAGVGGATGLGALAAAFIPVVAALTVTVPLVYAAVEAHKSLSAAVVQLKASRESLNAAEELANQKLREKGIALDEAAMKEMTFVERSAFRANAEKEQADTTLRAWIAHYAGRTATEEEFARARNLSLNEAVSAEEAARIAIADTNGSLTKTIVGLDAERTASFLDSINARASGTEELSVTEIQAAHKIQQEWINSQAGIVSSTEQSTGIIAGMIESLVSGIKSFFGGLFSMIGSGLRGIGVLGPISGAPTGLASGGTVAKSGWAVVGERGPELVQLPKGSTVFDTQQSQGAGGANVTINFGRDSVRTDADIRQIERSIAGLFRRDLMSAGVTV